MSYGKQIDSLLDMAWEKANESKNGDALALYDKVIRINPNIAEFYLNRGEIKSNTIDIDGAMADYDKAIAIDRNYKEAYAHRGYSKIMKYIRTSTDTLTAAQKQSACDDFYTAKNLGDGGVQEMIDIYCTGKQKRPTANDPEPALGPLIFLDSVKITRQQLSGVNPNDVLEVPVLKTVDKTIQYGREGLNGVLLITTQKHATEAYQKVLGSFSKEYASIAALPDTFAYNLNGVLLTGKPSEVIGKLYAIKLGDIKSVGIDQKGVKPVVSITTK